MLYKYAPLSYLKYELDKFQITGSNEDEELVNAGTFLEADEKDPKLENTFI